MIISPEQRYTPSVARFSELRSSLERPIETCGPKPQAGYLMRLRCDDGSAPFATSDAAAAARSGNAGKGGRCDNVIDHYLVECPEASYDVYMDLYMCSRAELPEPTSSTVVVDEGITVEVPAGWTYSSLGAPGPIYTLSGPGDVVLAGGLVSNTDPPRAEDLAPMFEALGVTPPTQIEERKRVDSVEMWLFPKDEFAGFAVALSDADGRRVVVGRGPAESLQQQVNALLSVLASSRANTHEYLDLSTVLTGETRELRVRLEDFGRGPVGVPDGWNVVVRDGIISAVLTDEGGTSLSFGRTDSAEDAESTLGSLAQAMVHPWISQHDRVTVLHAGHVRDDLYIVLLGAGENRTTVAVRKNRNRTHTLFFLIGDHDGFEKHSALVLFMALVNI